MVQAGWAAGEGPQSSASTPRLITLWGAAIPWGPIPGCERSCSSRVGSLLHQGSGMRGQREEGARPLGDTGSLGRASSAASCPLVHPPVWRPVNSGFFCLRLIALIISSDNSI